MKARVLPVAFLASVMLGVCVWPPENKGQAAKCDNKCRERFDHRSCSSGSCFSFDRRTCFQCATSASYRCYPQTGDPEKSECVPVDDSVTISYYESCTDVCDCAPGVTVIEAKDMNVVTTDSLTMTLYRCK